MKAPIDRTLAFKLAGLTVVMFGAGFAFVPLYGAFCKVTGFGGKTASAAEVVVPAPDTSRTVRVEFLASVPRGARWEFAPDVTHMDVHPGELNVAHFHATNLTGAATVAQAVPSIAPGLAAQHFHKTECFCFTQQAFAPHETRELTVAFQVAPELPAHIDTLSLSYTFYTVPQ
jgi:cytochrome c oxidase assembly protein subunit 11